MTLLPLFTEPHQLVAELQAPGFAVLGPEALCRLAKIQSEALQSLPAFWNDLPNDQYLRDGGRYRRRRHSCFVINDTQLQLQPHRAHWQPVEYNALHGGLERWFEPMHPQLVQTQVWHHLLVSLSEQCSKVKERQPWFVEAHQFRIDTTDGIGRPTPEGAHRDGVDFVAVILVARHGVKGGETRVFEANGRQGTRFTMTDPWTVLMLDDERVVHESTPIQPLSSGGYRDTLVLTFRRGGFQGPLTP